MFFIESLLPFFRQRKHRYYFSLSAVPTSEPLVSEGTLVPKDTLVPKGTLAPKGTSAVIIEKLNESLATALKDQKLREQLIQQGFEFVPLGPDHLKEMIAQGLAKMKRVIKDGGIQPD